MTGWENIWEQAEAFRQRYLVGKLAHLPVDVFTLVELELKLDVIPFDDLFAKYNVDAALLHDFTGIYVDAEAYILWEKGPVWKQNRLRFTVAHELGHCVLHREIAAQQTFTSFAAFALWVRDHNGKKYSLEQEANEFAGRLLVPRDRLISDFEEFARQAGSDTALEIRQ
jgi:Zn-dependent peptidase ImmA (M78 family)